MNIKNAKEKRGNNIAKELINYNCIVLKGKISARKTYSHSIFGEKIYTTFIKVMRLSGYEDNIPVVISEKLLKNELKIGDDVVIKGQIRTYSYYQDKKYKLDVTVFAKEVKWIKIPEDLESQVILEGYICKEPKYRRTPFGREITDLIVAVNRAYNKSDYIPTITWGKEARLCRKLNIGQKIKVLGRMQSRDYQKDLGNGKIEIRTAYELSVSEIDIIN